MTPAAAPRISLGEYFWLVAAAVVAGGVYLWPTPLLLAAGPDWGWALAADGSLMACVMAAQLAWARRAPGTGMFDRLRWLWGPLAWPWIVGSVALSTVVAGAFLALYVHMLQTFFFPDTPAWPLRVLLGGIAAVLATRSLDTVARNVRTWFVLSLVGFTFVVLTTAARANGLNALTPAWPPSAHLVTAGVAGTWAFWGDDGIALTFAPSARGVGLRGARRLAVGVAAFWTLMLALVSAIVLASLGPWASRGQLWPMIEIMVGAGPTSLSFLRPSLLILPVWTGAFVCYLGVRVFTLSANLRAATGAAHGVRPGLALALTAAAVAAACTLPSAPVLERLIISTLGPVALVWTLGLHGLTLLVSALRRVRRPLPAGAR